MGELETGTESTGRGLGSSGISRLTEKPGAIARAINRLSDRGGRSPILRVADRAIGSRDRHP